MKKILLLLSCAAILPAQTGTQQITSVYGTPASQLTLNNVLQYACGVPIGDGGAHTVGTPTGGFGCFTGITTLAGLAALRINGTAPFAWITAQSSPFAFSASSYNLTNSKVVNIDIAWLAIQTALLSQKTYIPAGTYEIGSVLPLPLYIPLSTSATQYLASPQYHILGDGEHVTNIIAGTDFGSGVGLMVCGDPAATSGATNGRWTAATSCIGQLENLSLWSSAALSGGAVLFTIGTDPVAMDGLQYSGHGSFARNIDTNGFHNDMSLVGDHSTLIHVTANGGTRGFYWDAPNSVLTGDWTFEDLSVTGVSQAAIAINGNASVTGYFGGETYLSGPYVFFGENNACAAMIYSAEFPRLMTEYTGNAIFHDDHVFSAGTYTDTNKCRALDYVTIGNFFPGWNGSNFWSTGSRVRRAAVDVGVLSAFRVDKLNSDGGQFNPSAAPTGPAPIATFNVNNLTSGGLGGNSIAGHIDAWLSSSGTLPLVIDPGTAPQYMYFEQPGSYKGLLTDWSMWGTSGTTYTTTTAGDVFENAAYSYAPGGLGYGSATTLPAGIAMQSGLVIGNNVLVPLQQTGTSALNADHTSLSWGFIRKGDGIGSTITITAAGTGATNGTYAFTGTGGGCTTQPTGTITASGGAITAVAITGNGAGCTSKPTIPTSSVTGSSGATLTAKWPGGLGTNAAASTPIVGQWKSNGVQLQGLQ